MSGEDRPTKRILVVEDEIPIGQLCQRVLTGEGLEVYVAANGRIAQGTIEKQRYDLCLIDIRTPEISGKELYQWLETEHPELIKGVVFTTGDVMSGDTPAFLQRAARPFLAKPFTPDELKAVIRKVQLEL